MNRKKAVRIGADLAVIALVAAVIAMWWLLGSRPSFTPEMALERAQRWYGSFFTGQVYELPGEAGGAVWLGRMGEEYGLVAAEKEGLLYRGTAVNTIRDLEGQPLVFTEGPEQIGLTENQGWFFGHVTDPDIARVEVFWKKSSQDPFDAFQSVAVTEFYDGMFCFPMGFVEAEGPWFNPYRVSADYILSAYDEEGELVCRYDQWNWQEGLWLEADGLRRVDWNWADGLPTVETEYTTVYIRP